MKKIINLFFWGKKIIFSQTAKDTYFITLGNILGLFLALLFMVITFRFLSHRDFGFLSGLWALVLLISDIADLGIGSSLSRFLPGLEKEKEQLKSFLAAAFFFQSIIAFSLFLIIFSLASFLANWLFHGEIPKLLLQITAVGIFGSIYSSFFFSALAARQKFKEAALLTVLNGGLRLIFLIVFFFFSAPNLKNAVLSQSLPFPFLALIGFFLLKINFFWDKETLKNLKRLLCFASYLGVARGLTAVAGRLDVLMLFALLNNQAAPVEAGIYSGAARFIAPYPLFAGSFSTVIAPKIASFSRKSDLKVFILKVILATLGLVFSIFLFMALAKPFLLLFLGEKSLPAVPVLRLLLFSQVFFVGSIPAVSIVIYYLKKPQILTFNSLLQILIVLVGNFFFIPKYGRFGPAISLCLAYGITLFLTSYLAYRDFQKK